MKIYIGTDFSGKPTSVLLADSVEKAHIAWMGMKDSPHSVEEIDPLAENLGMHGVAFLLTSREIEICADGQFRKFRKWIRGL